MAETHSLVLRLLATRFGRRITKSNLIYPGVSKPEGDPRTPHLWQEIPGNRFRERLRFQHKDRKVILMAKPGHLLLGLYGEYRTWGWSINAPYSLYRTQSVGAVTAEGQYPVYASDASDDATTAAWSNPEVRQFVIALAPREGESLQAHRNALEVVLRIDADVSAEFLEQRVLAVLEGLSRVGDVFQDADSQLPDLGALPPEFQDLVPLIRQWGISDDDERMEKLRRASPAGLRRLTAKVAGRLGTISAYLNSFGDRPLTDDAIALGALAECTMEAQLRLAE